MNPEMNRGDVWHVLLDPIKGSEQAGQRPCIIVSPESMNEQLDTIIVVPMSTQKRDWPTRVDIDFLDVSGQALCEQIRTVSKKRLTKKLGHLPIKDLLQVKLVLKQMLIE